jgi:hypothetical protein
VTDTSQGVSLMIVRAAKYLLLWSIAVVAMFVGVRSASASLVVVSIVDMADGATYLASLFSSSSGPADDSSELEIKVVSVPLPGAGAIPASVNGTGSGSGGFAVASDLGVLAHAALQTALPPEASAVLPTGPPYCLFRPPRRTDFSRVDGREL